MTTTNPVPSNDPTDLLFNAQKLDQVVNGSAQSYTDRLGVTRRTMAGIDASADAVLGGLGYAPPVAYAAGIALTLTTQTVEYAGNVYAPKIANLPFTTTTWAADSAKFRLIQGVAATDLAASGGSSLIGYMPAGTGAVSTTVQSKLRETVSVLDFGADPTGSVDSTVAVQRATNTGKCVVFPEGTYKVSGVTYVGRVVWQGQGDAKILSDSAVITVTNGSDSQIDNLKLENIASPWIISRDSANWASVPAVVQSNALGYQPTVNDADVWSTLTTDQQNQNIGPRIVFQGDASNIQVSRITGRFVSVILYDAQYSTVRDCNFRAAKGLAGGISFWNINSKPGYYNKAINNHISYPSFNGIVFARNFDGTVSGNTVEYAGESGVKFYQDMLGGVDARCYKMQVSDNYTKYAYFDGFDLSSDYPHTGAIDSRHTVVGNSTYGNRQTGFHADGGHNQFIGNLARACGKSGMFLTYNYSQIEGNYVYDCNTSNTATGHHQLAVLGSNNAVIGNFMKQTVANGYAYYDGSSNYVAHNFAQAGILYTDSSSIVVGNNDSSSATHMTSNVPQQVRQDAVSNAAMRLYSESTSFDNVDLVLHPRKHILSNPIAGIRGQLSYGVNGAENGYLVGYGAQNGALVPGWMVQTANSIPGKAWTTVYAPNAAINGGELPNGSFAAYLDESGNVLKFVVRYSSGTTKTGTVSLA